MGKRTLVLVAVVAYLSTAAAGAQSPELYSNDGKYLGNLNANPYDPNSVANPYGQYGSKYSPNSINNQYGQYGSPYSPTSVNNPYATTSSPVVVSPGGAYLGRANSNPYDMQSVSNPYGSYGNRYSPTSIQNPYGQYGNPYSQNSATNQYGFGRTMNQQQYGFRRW